MKHIITHWFGSTQMEDVTERVVRNFTETKRNYLNKRKPEIAKDVYPTIAPLYVYVSPFRDTGGSEDKDRPPVFVVTNNASCLGANMLFNTEFMDSALREEFNADEMFVLPSSIHEVLLMPAREEDIKDLTAMVRHVNRTEVSKDEWLWDSVLLYERGGKLYEACN